MAVQSVGQLNLWARNVAQFKNNPQRFYLTDRLELKQGKRDLPETQKVIKNWRRVYNFNALAPEEHAQMELLCTSLESIYKEKPKDAKVFKWIRESLPDIGNKEKYLKKLQGIMTLFYIAKESHRFQKERRDLLDKGIKISNELKTRQVTIKYSAEHNTVKFEQYYSKSTHAISFMILYIGKVKKQSKHLSQNSKIDVGEMRSLEHCLPFIKKHAQSDDAEVRRLAESVLLEYDYHKTLDTIQTLKWVDINEPQRVAFDSEWLNSREEYFNNLDIVINNMSHFVREYGDHYSFSDFSEEAEEFLGLVKEPIDNLGQEVKLYSSLYAFFYNERNITIEKGSDSSFYKLYCSEIHAPSPKEYDSIHPLDVSPIFSHQEEPPSLPKEKRKDDFLPDHLKKTKKKPAPKKKEKAKVVPTEVKPPKLKQKEKEAVLPSKEPQQKVAQGSWRQQIKISEAVQLFYAEHVTRWFDDCDEVLQTEEYVTQPSKAKTWAKYAHTFPQFVDQFVGTSYCYKGSYENPRTGNKDVLHSIPAEMTTPIGTERVLFQYAVDSKTGVCYHRCIHRIPDEEFIQTLLNEKVWNRIDYPTVDETIELQKSAPMKYKGEAVPFTYEPTFGAVSFNEGDFGITLFRLEL